LRLTPAVVDASAQPRSDRRQPGHGEIAKA
jgi:hypothetical protein